jgi:hypothetical protein
MQNLTSTDWDNKIRSFKIGKGVKLTLCTDELCVIGKDKQKSETIGYKEVSVMNWWDKRTSWIQT